jgi:uncharacterized protein (DUF433 family)
MAQSACQLAPQVLRVSSENRAFQRAAVPKLWDNECTGEGDAMTKLARSGRDTVAAVEAAEPDGQKAQMLIARWIESNPHRPGKANTRVREHGVSVWALIGHAQAIRGDSAQVARDYELPQEAVEAAFIFYRRHKAIIDDRLAANVA